MARRHYYLGCNATAEFLATGHPCRVALIARPGGPNAPVDAVFPCEAVPTFESHGHLFAAVVGPFRTKRAAVFMAMTAPNPHCHCVADAERLVKLYPGLGKVQ
jgi:hypothetical protein